MTTYTQEVVKELLWLAFNDVTGGFTLEPMTLTPKRQLYQLTVYGRKFQAIKNNRKGLLEWNWKPVD